MANNKKTSVSIIIPSYNEQTTIASVIKDCRRFNPTSQIVVVNDGSTDQSHQVITKLQKKIKFDYCHLKKNQGKSAAMVAGIKKAKHPIILFFDADLSGIKKSHFKKILKPILNQKADMVLGQPTDTLINYSLNPFKSFTGQRALYKKDIQPLLNDIRHIKFGVETYLNLYYKSAGKTVKLVSLPGLIHPTKYSKTNPFSATKDLLDEGHQIATTYFKNYHLILKQVENSLRRSSGKFKNFFKSLK